MKFDGTDAAMVVGVLMMLGGVAVVHWPTAIALTGLMIAALALLSAGRQRR
jgi:divalent metal cation (Fe/Co/Zn/Cd) transporter